MKQLVSIFFGHGQLDSILRQFYMHTNMNNQGQLSMEQNLRETDDTKGLGWVLSASQVSTCSFH
jgi:hypothetical protein